MTTEKATNGNPFLDFDVTKIMSEFDPAKFAGQFAKFADQYNIPGFDVDSVLETQRRNFEALTAANQAAVEGVRALAKRQSEILQQTMDAAQKAVSQFGKAGTPQDTAAKQAEIAKTVFEKAIANSQELAQLAAKSNAEATQLITARISEGLGEIQALAKNLNK